MFFFPYSPSSQSSIIGFNQIQINPSSIPELTIYQESSTTHAFFDIARILVQTSKLPVDGDIESENTSIQLLTDVVPDVDTLNPGSALIFAPLFLRWYNLYQNAPLTNIDIFISYSTKDGTIYPLPVNPGEWWSTKLEFRANAQGSDV
jgi:hypothetical protein